MKITSISLCIFFLALIALFECVPIDETNTKCQNHCELEYTPICATDDEGKTRTFSNMCVLKSENCLQQSNYQKTADGPCP